MRFVLIFFIVTAIVGCSSGSFSGITKQSGLPESLGEEKSGFTYIPLDPLWVNFSDCEKKDHPYDPILDELPDNAVRISTKQIYTNSKFSFGPVGLGVAGESYRIVLDFVNVDNTNVRFRIRQIEHEDKIDGEIIKKKTYQVQRLIEVKKSEDQPNIKSKPLTELPKIVDGESVLADNVYVIPVYVGVGLRLTAEVTVLKGNVNLSSLPGIAASIDAGDATGSLIVQTLGITGKQISNGLVFTSDLNSTTVQNAVLSLGKIKAVLYSEDAIVRPRVTGMYLPLPDGSDELVNMIVSELAKQEIQWVHKCKSGQDSDT